MILLIGLQKLADVNFGLTQKPLYYFLNLFCDLKSD